MQSTRDWTPDDLFGELSKSYLDRSTALSPVYATYLGDHRFDGVTAFLQHAGAGTGRQVMRRDDHAPPGSNRLQHRYGAARRQASAYAAASALDGWTVTPADRKTVSCALRFCGSLSVPVTDAITAVSLRSCEASCVAR